MACLFEAGGLSSRLIKKLFKMKFTVEVEEFYLEEGELAIELQKQVKADVIGQIRGLIKAQVDTFMDTHIKNELGNALQGRVQAAMEDFLATGKIKDPYSSGNKEKTMKEWLEEYVRGKSADIHKVIAAEVAKMTKALTDRYDLAFAGQLINKIKDAGFLREDAAKLLLTSEGGN